MQNRREVIEKKIRNTLEVFSFENMKKNFPEFCPCYKTGKCHVSEELNCFFCFCPEYDSSKQEGGCKINSNDGKWFFNDKLPGGKIWDCSQCLHPHKEENAKELLKKMMNLQ